ncbi:MAG TPA: insulinase family protein [Bacteroidaceae bacterium]|nr:insulinase family protein [Bacteroidaceae bacterium]
MKTDLFNKIYTTLFLMLLITLPLFADNYTNNALIPIDPEVRIGRLENGITYYIRHNKKPENQVCFYIAQKVGSILEENNQRGLAHFLEHMCFNGTKNFPGNSLIKYLESIGVKFGANLNAYTSIDETVYNIDNVPVNVPGAIDSCLVILCDWADGLLLDGDEIESERGVIREEWRTRQKSSNRMIERVLPEIFGDNRYGHRLPIGLIEVIDSFPHQALRDYYEKWYRPDLQGIVIVGDIDVDIIERKVIDLFKGILMPENVAERVYYEIEDNDEPIVSVQRDKEMDVVTLMLLNKHNVRLPQEKEDMDYFVHQYALSIINSMFSMRFAEILQKPDAPFISADAFDDIYFVAKTKGAFTGYANLKEESIEEGVKQLFYEIMRAKRHGFTESEYKRARANYIRMVESEYNERHNTQSAILAKNYIRNFIDGEPIPGFENNYNIINEIAPRISVEYINSVIDSLISNDNWTIILLGPDKEEIEYPDKEDLKLILHQVINEHIEPYSDRLDDKPLIEKEPDGGRIKRIKKSKFGTTLLKLSNGARVVVLPTEYQRDEIQLTGFARGGNSLFHDSLFHNYYFLNSVVGLGGLGDFSTIDLSKTLSGKKVALSSGIGTYTENIDGYCSPNDFEILSKLIYLSFTSPRKDEEAYESYRSRAVASLLNQEVLPSITLSDSLKKAMYGDHPRAVKIGAEMVDRLDYDLIMNMYKKRFSDAGNFTFIMVGNIEIDSITPHIEKYIATLPTTKLRNRERDTKYTILEGKRNVVFEKNMETPLATVNLIYSSNSKYNTKNIVKMSMMEQIMRIVYTEQVREKEGGTYGVSTQGSISMFPKQKSRFVITFDTDPTRWEYMTDIVIDHLERFAEHGPSERDLSKVKEYMLKHFNEIKKDNKFWSNTLKEWYWTGTDTYSNYEKIVNKITVGDLRKFAKSILKRNNVIKVVMVGKEE